MKPRHFLSITDLKVGEIKKILRLAIKLKKELKTTGRNKLFFKNKTLAAIYEKPSLRTRLSFEAGMTQLGGHSIYLGPNDIQLGKRESSKDIGIVTSSMVDIIMARTFKHQTVVDLAEGSSVPLINGLTDLEHPCQILADFQTILEKFKTLNNLTIVFVGDGNNNVTHSLALMSAMLGNEFRCASPKGFQMKPSIKKQARIIAEKTKGKIIETTDPKKAVNKADVVITDTWTSMGKEAEKKKRIKIFAKYQVNNKLIKLAKPKAIFMHCLPAYRGFEVSAEVIDGLQSVVYQEAENRLHAQKALMVYLTQGGLG